MSSVCWATIIKKMSFCPFRPFPDCVRTSIRTSVEPPWDDPSALTTWSGYDTLTPCCHSPSRSPPRPGQGRGVIATAAVRLESWLSVQAKPTAESLPPVQCCYTLICLFNPGQSWFASVSVCPKQMSVFCHEIHPRTWFPYRHKIKIFITFLIQYRQFYYRFDKYF